MAEPSRIVLTAAREDFIKAVSGVGWASWAWMDLMVDSSSWRRSDGRSGFPCDQRASEPSSDWQGAPLPTWRCGFGCSRRLGRTRSGSAYALRKALSGNIVDVPSNQIPSNPARSGSGPRASIIAATNIGPLAIAYRPVHLCHIKERIHGFHRRTNTVHEDGSV